MARLSKQEILRQIKQTAAENGGAALGRRKFETATGIGENDWSGVYWANWADAVAEAGLTLTTEFTKKLDDEHLLRCMVSLIREKGRFPSVAEVKLRRRSDSAFPDEKTFRRLGRKHEFAQRLIDYAKALPGHEDVAAICEPVARAAPDDADDERADAISEPEGDEAGWGEVYMLKSGKHYKIGRTNSVGRRERELAIQLPERAVLVHKIRTDDAVGIEAYWHKRFEDRWTNGEWFALTSQDVAAFRRRKTFM